jgi:subtilisin family serine protease
VKHPLLSVTALVLIVATLATPVEADSDRVFTIPLVYHDSYQSAISVLVEGFDDIGPKEVRFLSDFGTVTTVAGRVAVLHTESEQLPSVARLSFISRIERSWPLHAYLDKSVPDIGADTVWQQVRDSLGRNVTGRGVVIGFVDTGIDISHPDFAFPNGTTKITYVWDQTIQGRPPSAFGYGYECTSDDIQAGRCPENDTFGHGTHVAGIATSSGRATGNYTGVAPDAEIIFVKSGYEVCQGAGWTFDSSKILDGINYIVMRARELGKRVVINLSLGGNIGGHDGSDLMELALDGFVEAGTPVVVAAGNGAQDNAHIQGRIAKDGNVTFDVAVRATTTDLAIDVWYPVQDQVDATLTMPSGSAYTVPAATGEVSGHYGNVTTLAKSTDLGRESYFEVTSATSLPTRGWSVTLRARHVDSDGVWDAWVDTASCAVPGASFLPGIGYNINRNDTIGIPGTAHYVVTVGAYVTRTFWKGMNNQAFGSNLTSAGGIASFSSWGPTRDGRTKPDVVAPGTLIASARSEAIAEKPSDPDLFHRILAGTSMAAPHVAGTIALMLQYSPNLDAIEVPRIIRETARQDSYTGVLLSGSPIWGFGKIDARTATGLIRLTLTINGLPVGIKVPFHVDDRELEVIVNSWLDLYFPQGTTHMIAAARLLNAGEEMQYRLANAKLIVGTKTIRILNYTVEKSVEYSDLNETTFLILNYELIPAPNPFILVLPLISLLALAIAALSLTFELYLVRRRVYSAREED